MFIRHLKDAQTQTETALDGIRNGRPPARPARKWRNLNHRMESVRRRYLAGSISLNKYWRAMSHFVGMKV